MKPPVPDRNRGDLTRDALILAAMTVFGRDGFHATTTRAIAEEAKVNQALIGYHFGGKEGLYLAMFEHIAGQLGERLGPLVDAIGHLLETPVGPDETDLRSQAEAALLRLAEGMLMLMTRPEYASWAQLVLREQQSPTRAFEILYERFMGCVLTLLEQLVRRLRGDSAGDPRLLVVTLLGQLLVFRAARTGVLRFLEWSRIGETELAAIQAQLRRNIAALLVPVD